MSPLPEVWMRGPVQGIPALLQPVAHTLLQAQEEIHELMDGFPDTLLWQRPEDIASPAFHLQHIPGVLDRLFTYAKGNLLSNDQLKYLSEEGLETEKITAKDLLSVLDHQIQQSIQFLSNVNPSTLTEERTVGRKKLPSTVIGLLFHAAEHTMRHAGQLRVTLKWVVNHAQ